MWDPASDKPVSSYEARAAKRKSPERHVHSGKTCEDFPRSMDEIKEIENRAGKQIVGIRVNS